MSKMKYSEVEMIGALKQMEAGRGAAEVEGAARVEAYDPTPGKRNTAG